MKKGNKEGITELAHKERLDFTAGKFDFENNNKLKVKIINKNGKKILLKLKIKRLNLCVFE